MVFLFEKKIEAFKIKNREIDFKNSVVFETQKSNFDEKTSLFLLQHIINSPTREFWFIFSQSFLSIFTINFQKDILKINFISQIFLEKSFNCILSVSDNLFLGISDNLNLIPFFASKTSVLYFKSQKLDITLKSEIRTSKNISIEFLNKSISLNLLDQKYRLINGNYTPEIILLSKNKITKMRFRNHIDFVQPLIEDYEFVRIFRFQEQLLLNEIQFFFGIPFESASRLLKVT